MNPKPPLISGRDLVKAFGKMGYRNVSQKGSHIKMKNDDTGSVSIIPDHKELDRWTLKSILKDAEITEEQLKKYL
ncbi:MAG: type II toxin-antitoxin system HicA family toxin [Deltaproteobacteria bacterium]|nr:type II toxin-antitoxin system HicA family toxin [Deltaproteobacteria bacterium]